MRLFILAAGLAALTACGADIGEPCTTDEDCAGDLVCHEHEDGDAVCEEGDAHDHDDHEEHDDTGA